MLKIKNLTCSIQDDQQTAITILHGLNLEMEKGQVHTIMGPNGSGKSTLANVLAGKPEYKIDGGEVFFADEGLLALTPDERAARGLFLAFQYPTEMPGVNNMYFLRTAMNSIRKKKDLPPIDAADFLMLVREKIKLVGLDDGFLKRNVNEGFSGGEKKRNEMLQMLILEPQFIILDEIDSGLDIDALQQVATCVNILRAKGASILMVTHYQRLLNYIQPDVIHVMANGKILKSGDKSLALELEKTGYGWIENGG